VNVTGYVAESALVTDGATSRLDLATALGVTPQGLVDNPVFFSGFVERPDVVASGLLAVADVAASRYADAALGKRLANLDPVVTAGGDRLRFESFSACNSVYARLDLLPGALGSSDVGFGTTNVDVNQPLRSALAAFGRGEALHLSVGRDELRASTPTATHMERKVTLPDRWVRGLAEVPSLSAAMRPRASLDGAAVARFLGSLPRVSPPGPALQVVPIGAVWRTTSQRTAASFPLPGSSRLRGADRVLRFATRLDVHAADNGTVSWVFTLPGARLTLVLSPDPYRGFSGEGALLTLLTDRAAEANGTRILGELGWAATIDPDDLSRRTGLRVGQVASGLAWLAASGRLGHDRAEGAWFHRELPVDAGRVLRRHPRLVAAHQLVDDGSLVREGDAWTAPSSWAGMRYRITRREGVPPGGDDAEDLLAWRTTALQCECAWESEHAGTRGPCKHVLAVILLLRE
jgi:hypothetical protein